MTEKGLLGLFARASTLKHLYFEIVSNFEFRDSNLALANAQRQETLNGETDCQKRMNEKWRI
jgi:hypothetical protein